MKKFMMIWMGELISSIGSGMTAFAVSTYIYQLTRSATLVSIAALPFVNTCAEVLLRIRIPNDVQGRAWGMISTFTQIGFVIAFAFLFGSKESIKEIERGDYQ